MIVVVGGGVVGLASALALARRGRSVCVVERHARLGQETSTHNSGVIHAGLYYPQGSLKAQLCLEGRERLYGFCNAFDVPHTRCGKLIVAPADARAELDRVRINAEANGATVVEVDASFVSQREPHVAAAAALWSPDSGWLQAEHLVRALESQLLRYDGIVLTGTTVTAVEPRQAGGLTVVTNCERIEADLVVNAAGVHADDVSRLANGEDFRIYACRGEYAELGPKARHLVNGLVYPVPDPSGHGLGVHLTRTLDGNVWIGPTIRFQDNKDDYEGERLPLEEFVQPTQALLPSITLEDLRLGSTGIRAKLHPPSERFADFLVRRDELNPYLIHAAGIDSPGLTACLAIGERVATLTEE